MAGHPDQLELAIYRTLADQIVDRRRRPATGPARLLTELVRRGLDPDALRPAAALSVALDDDARRTDSRAG